MTRGRRSAPNPRKSAVPIVLAGAFAFTGALIAGGCDGPAAERSADADLPRWSAEPDLQIGSLDGGADALTRIRAMEVNESGRIYTMHPEEQVIRVFEPDGTFLAYIGGRGSGPGEFENVINMGWVSDTLWVLDANGYRFSHFSESGEFLHDFSVPFRMGDANDPQGSPRADGLLFDGTIHGSRPSWSRMIASGELTHRATMLLTREGQPTDTLPAIPFGNNQWAVYDPDNPDVGGSYGRQPFADGPLWGFAHDEHAVLRLDREAPQAPDEAAFRLSKLSFAGDTIFSREYAFEPLPIPETAIDSILDARAQPLGERGFLGATVPRARQWAERTLYLPPFRSLVEAMVVGRDGTVWVRRTSDSDPVPWLVLDESGEAEAEVHLPRGFTLVQADRSHAWGWETDAFDVPYVVRYRLTRREES